MIERTIGFIGAGKMAEALARGVIGAGVAEKQNVLAADPAEERRRVFAEGIGARALEDNAQLASAAEVIVLSVKPQVLPAVVEEIATSMTPDHLIISIAPGVKLTWLAEKLGTVNPLSCCGQSVDWISQAIGQQETDHRHDNENDSANGQDACQHQ